MCLLLRNEKIRDVIDTTRLKGRASPRLGPLRVGLRYWNGCARSCANETTSPSYSTSTSRRRRTSLRQCGLLAGLSKFDHRRYHQPQVIAAGAASDDPRDHGPVPADHRARREALRHAVGLVDQNTGIGSLSPSNIRQLTDLIETMDAEIIDPAEEAVGRAGGAESEVLKSEARVSNEVEALVALCRRRRGGAAQHPRPGRKAQVRLARRGEVIGWSRLRRPCPCCRVGVAVLARKNRPLALPRAGSAPGLGYCTAQLRLTWRIARTCQRVG